MPDGRHSRFLRRGALLLALLLGVAACTPSLPGVVPPKLPVEISGIDGPPYDNLVALLTPELSTERAPVDTFRLQQLARQAPRIVHAALVPFGYYASTVTSRVAEGILYLAIEPGLPVRVSRVETSVTGTSSPPLLRALASFPLAAGDPLLHETYEQGKEEALEAAHELGYLDAYFSRHQVLVDPGEQTAQIFLTLESGPLYRVGELRFEQADGYPLAFLHRHVTLEPGEPLTHSGLNTTRQQFRDSGRFANVVLTPLLDQVDAQGFTPIAIRLEPEPRRQLRPGIGYGTDTGARASLRYQDLNAFKRGHRFGVDGLLAEFRRSITVDYTIPGQNIDTQTVFRTGFEGEYLDSYVTRYAFTEGEQFLGIGRNRIVSGYGRFQREDSEIGEKNIDKYYLLGGVRYRQGKVDNPLRPRRGYHFSLEWRGTNEQLLSDVTLGQFMAALRVIVPVGRPVLLHLRANSATTVQENEFEEIPASLRFFAGGDRSVRGYAYQSLGPKDVDGNVIGGKNLLTASLELEWLPFENWGFAGFYDTGNAFNSYAEMDLAEAAGIGVRYYSFIGPIWLDVARTVATPDPDYRLHFGLGLTW